jgi:hypothetical protein
MKKDIKELGLELILIGDNILLIDINRKPVIGETGYCNEGTWNGTLALIENEPITDVWVKIVGSKKELRGGIPLLVEDLGEEAEFNEYKDKDLFDRHYGGFDFNIGYKQGYDKAKENYKYTEEDMVRAFNVGINSSFEGHSKNLGKDDLMDFYSKKIHNLILSITQKQLWIEVELEQVRVSDKTGYEQLKVVPKVLNNKIIGIWK